MCKDNQGFTLFELLIVMAIFFAAAAVAVPQIQSSVSGERLLSSVDGLAAEINMARTMAVSRNTTYEMRFERGGDTFQIIDPEDPENPPRIAKSLGQNINFAAAPASNIRFFARGHSSGGNLVVASGTGSSCTVSILPSGHVQVGEFQAYEE